MPDSWTSINGNTLDWTYELQLHSVWDVLEAIRQAVKERCLASGTTVPTLLNTAVVPLYLVKEYTDSIQSTITTLIPKFVNHTDNSGDWTGQATIPNWTEVNLLTAISAGSRLTVANLYEVGPWAKQQYLVLNMLKWINAFHTGTVSSYYKSGKSGSYADAVSAFNSAAWVSASNYDATQYENAYADGLHRWAVGRSKSQWAYTNNTSFDLSFDMYRGAVPYYNGHDTTYFDLDYPPEIPLLAQYKFQSGNIAIGDTFSFWIGDFETITIPELPYPEMGGYRIKIKNEYGDVLKFDGAGGFKFKNW